jgi:hypothetical protein
LEAEGWEQEQRKKTSDLVLHNDSISKANAGQFGSSTKLSLDGSSAHNVKNPSIHYFCPKALK